MNILSECADWPVDHVSAVVIAGSDTYSCGDAQRVYELASVTKILTTMTALVAIVEEAISLDTPLGPENSTVRHILSHTSGLSHDGPDTLALPGQQRIYSSYSFALLAELLTRETGIPFEEYFHQAVVEPLGLKHTTLAGPAGFGMRSCAADLAVVAREVISPRLLPRELYNLACQVHFPEVSGFVPGYGKHHPNPWGLGFEVHGSKKPHWLGEDQPEYTVGHFGQAGTFMWLDRRADVAAIVLTDRPFGPWAKPLWSDFNNRLYRAIFSL